MPTIAEQISKKSTTPSSNIATALEGYNGGGGSGANAGGTLVIGGFSYDNSDEVIFGISDKTWQEIDNALAVGARCVIVVSKNDGHYQMNITQAVVDDGDYSVIGNIGGNNFIAIATSADGYPATENGHSVS